MLRGTNWGQKFAYKKKEKANIRSVPRPFSHAIFLSLEREGLFNDDYSKLLQR